LIYLPINLCFWLLELRKTLSCLLAWRASRWCCLARLFKVWGLGFGWTGLRSGTLVGLFQRSLLGWVELRLNFRMMIRTANCLMGSGGLQDVIQHLVNVNLSCSACFMGVVRCQEAVSLTNLSFSAIFLRRQ